MWADTVCYVLMRWRGWGGRVTGDMGSPSYRCWAPQPPVWSVFHLFCSRGVAVFGLIHYRGMSASRLTHLSLVVLVTVRPCQLAFSILEPSGVSSTCTPPHRLCVDISDTPAEPSYMRLSQPCRTAGLFGVPFPLSFLFYFWRLEGTPGL